MRPPLRLGLTYPIVSIENSCNQTSPRPVKSNLYPAQSQELILFTAIQHQQSTALIHPLPPFCTTGIITLYDVHINAIWHQIAHVIPIPRHIDGLIAHQTLPPTGINTKFGISGTIKLGLPTIIFARTCPWCKRIRDPKMTVTLPKHHIHRIVNTPTEIPSF